MSVNPECSLTSHLFSAFFFLLAATYFYGTNVPFHSRWEVRLFPDADNVPKIKTVFSKFEQPCLLTCDY